MKKQSILFVSILFSFIYSSAQWTTSGTNIFNSNTGFVGIGTSTPTRKLTVSATSSVASGTNSAADVLTIQSAASTGSTISFNLTGRATHTSGTVAQVVGLNTTAEHNGSGSVTSLKGIQSIPQLSGSGSVTDLMAFTAVFSRPGTGTATNAYGLYINNFSAGLTNKWGVYVTDATAKNYFAGSLCLGTTSDFGYKLAVNGTAIFTEAKVKLFGAWPDYVFDDNYTLRSLEDLEKYIQQNKHLPDMPSSDEVSKNKGFELGDMNIKLLRKVEELTLYVIELKKENAEIKADLKRLSGNK
ncbi:MAG: hypothetical protein JST09_17740 [Bacteroidetes bacterium]|nr:hypothetical protein [Bacteroidota bacterium]MBS1747706.1 hypothetical protein [Bacteroidota bacterium]